MAPKGIAVVTGGSKGIGRAIASRLAWLGYSIRILSRDQAAAQDAIARFEGAYNHKAMECDVAKRETIQAAFRTIATEGTLTTVINAAGINTDGLVPRLSPSALDSMLTVNLAGAIAVTSEATRLMLRQRQRGSIINISSATAHVANPGQSIYSATKAGLEGFTRTAARELAPKQIRLNCIAPGYVDTDMTRHLDSSKLVASIPLGRLGAYEDVTQAAEYLISSDYVTGQTIVVDGGLSL